MYKPAYGCNTKEATITTIADHSFFPTLLSVTTQNIYHRKW